MALTNLLPFYVLLLFFVRGNINATDTNSDVHVVEPVNGKASTIPQTPMTEPNSDFHHIDPVNRLKTTVLHSRPMSDGFFANPVKVDLAGNYDWQLVFDYANYNNSKSITKTIKITHTTSYNYNSLEKSIRKSTETMHGEAKIAAKGQFEILSVNAYTKSSIDNTVSDSFDTMVDKKREDSVTTVDTGVFTIGPNSRFALYKLVFNGAGLVMSTGITATQPMPIENATISCQVRQKLFIKNIDVVYTEQLADRPRYSILEKNGVESSINRGPELGFDQLYSWLVPIWTTDTDEAATSIALVHQTQKNTDYKDLFLPDSWTKPITDRTYLRMLHEDKQERIVKLGLIRLAGLYKVKYYETIEPSWYNWEKCTADINMKRDYGGSNIDLIRKEVDGNNVVDKCKRYVRLDRVYLCWNSTMV